MSNPTIMARDIKADLARVVAELKLAHPGLVLQYRWLATDTIHLDVISLPKAARNGGIGTEVMQRLSEHAMATGMRIMLVPDSCFGSDLYRLRQFYRRFGFQPVRNKMVLR